MASRSLFQKGCANAKTKASNAAIRERRMSKFLSFILRHQPYSLDIELDEFGYALSNFSNRSSSAVRTNSLKVVEKPASSARLIRSDFNFGRTTLILFELKFRAMLQGKFFFLFDKQK